MHWVERHPAHLASTFFVSPFDEAAVCAIDGFGDFVSTSWAVDRRHTLEVLDHVYFPRSLGLFYLAVTQYLGFLKYGDEYKVMGLAPYGTPTYVEDLCKLLREAPGGHFALDLSYFTHWTGGGRMSWNDEEATISPVFSKELEELLGPARQSEEPILARHEAIAASLKVVFEDAVSQILSAVYDPTRLATFCLAGGRAMNSVMNGKICAHTVYAGLHPACGGDNGTALGAALWVWHQLLGHERSFVMDHAYWGPEANDDSLTQVVTEHAELLQQRGCSVREAEDNETLCRWTAELLPQETSLDGSSEGWSGVHGH
jgi:carbamoyltransferase